MSVPIHPTYADSPRNPHTPMALERISRNLSVLRELAAFLRARRLWWLLPMVTVFVLVAVLLVLAQSSAVAPLLYPLF